MQADHVLAHDCILGGKSAPTFPALDKLWSHKSAGNMGKKRSKAMEHAHDIGCGLGEARQTSLMLARWAKSAEKPGKRRNGTPMMPMMLAKGASIISIIGGPFLHFWPPMHPMTPHW